jgi:hypothetical protein
MLKHSYAALAALTLSAAANAEVDRLPGARRASGRPALPTWGGST